MSDHKTRMLFGYSIIYVSNVPKTLVFYEVAFGLQTCFLHESQLYGELETGETKLAFAANEMAKLNGLSVRANRADETAAGYEIALVTEDPKSAFERAVSAGASPVKPPETKPWGQVVAYVRDNNGCIVEICSPIKKASGEV
jgi:uncharacterized glyoxalase superfamily protein PhnB